MSTVVMHGGRDNIVGLLRLMADELEQGLSRSATCFSEDPAWDPTITFELIPDERRAGPGSTTMKVLP